MTLSEMKPGQQFTSGNSLKFTVKAQLKYCTLITETVHGLEKYIPHDYRPDKLKFTIWFEKGVPAGLQKA